jgi:hypothetical protein
VFLVDGLVDGTYDVIIVDADSRDNGAMAIDIALSSGPLRGEVVTIVATGLGRDAIDLLAMPATLVVVDGEPHLTLDG